MTFIRPAFSLVMRPLLFTLMLLAQASLVPAYADDYTDVSALMRSGRLVEASARIDQFLSAKPRDPQMRFFRGVIQTETNRSADAILTFTRLTEDFPELPEPYNNLAVLHAGQGQFDKARSALEMAIRTNPSYATAHENLGDVYARLASQAYSKALQLDSGNTGIAPKLALIRELFSASARPSGAAMAAAAPAANPAGSTGSASSAGPAGTTSPAAGVPPGGQVAGTATGSAGAPAAPTSGAGVAAPSAAAGSAAGVATGAAADAQATRQVDAALKDWAAAWAARDVKRYLAAYSSDFATPARQSRSAWEQERTDRIAGKKRISLALSDVVIEVKGSNASARFRQAYSADGLKVNSRKVIDFVRTGERWLIVREGSVN